MTGRIFTGAALLALLAVQSCKKKEEEVKCVAGTGGNLTLHVYMQHHEHLVGNLKNYRDTIYIKYNTQEYPGSNPADYDATITGEWPGDSVSIPNLKCGDYYIYSVGFAAIHSVRVSGGVPFSTKQTEGTASIIIPVSE